MPRIDPAPDTKKQMPCANYAAMERWFEQYNSKWFSAWPIKGSLTQNRRNFIFVSHFVFFCVLRPWECSSDSTVTSLKTQVMDEV